MIVKVPVGSAAGPFGVVNIVMLSLDEYGNTTSKNIGFAVIYDDKIEYFATEIGATDRAKELNISTSQQNRLLIFVPVGSTDGPFSVVNIVMLSFDKYGNITSESIGFAVMSDGIFEYFANEIEATNRAKDLNYVPPHPH